MAIGVILAMVFIVMGAISAVMIYKNSVKVTKSRMVDDRKKAKKGNVVAISMLAVAVVGFAVVPMSFHTVDAGEIAVVKTLGQITNTRTAGTYFDFWLTKTYDIYDAKVQQITIETQAYTADSQPMDINLTVQFKIQQENIKEIAVNYGGLELLTNRIEAVSVERTKSVLSKYKAETLIADRANISPEVETSIKEAISDKFYVDFNSAVLTDITFSDAFEKAVEDKMTAEQEKLKAEYENEKKIAQAEAELEIAKNKAEAKIAEAEGNAEAARVIAQAEADAVKFKSIEVARMLGFEIKETTTADGVTEYFISFEGKTEEQIALISDYLKYIEYLEKWNGELPDTLVTEGGANILIPSVGGNSSPTQP